MTFEVQSGIAPPKGRVHKYPFATMEKEEHFQFPSRLARTVRSAACNWAKRYGGKFTVQKDKVPGFHLCWRVE